jgi:hypothetical protein
VRIFHVFAIKLIVETNTGRRAPSIGARYSMLTKTEKIFITLRKTREMNRSKQASANKKPTMPSLSAVVPEKKKLSHSKSPLVYAKQLQDSSSDDAAGGGCGVTGVVRGTLAAADSSEDEIGLPKRKPLVSKKGKTRYVSDETAERRGDRGGRG